MKMIIRFKQFLRQYWAPLIIAVVINSIVLVNTILHHPKIGYDVTSHLTNIQIYPIRFPTPQDSSEFFSAPLSYLLPSLYDKICVYYLPAKANVQVACRGADGRVAQVINLLLSIGITLIFWKIAERLKPGSVSLKVSILSMLGILTVYYRTFSQARGEPYIAFFISLVMLQILDMLLRPQDAGWKSNLKLGFSLGLLILSRQWGFFIFPALGLLALVILLKDKAAGWRFIRGLLISGVVAFVVGGWFYLHLYFTYGSFTTFNINSPGFSIFNQPPSFYFGTGLKNLLLFKTPVRPAFDRSWMPVFYSDIWGDYWCYFTCVINVTAPGMSLNREQISPYLGRVNLVSLFPSLLLLAGAGLGLFSLVRSFRRAKYDPLTVFAGFVFAVVVFSWLGYMVFLISFPGNPLTNKATYLIQVFMALAVLGGMLLEKLKERKPLLFHLCILGLGLVFIHNLPAMFTHFHWV